MFILRKSYLAILILLIPTGIIKSQIFTDISGDQLTGLSEGSSAWGDYDNDGDLDVVITGKTELQTYFSAIYRNDGNNVFTDIGAGLPGVHYSFVAWGDYDNDGDLDLLITGTSQDGFTGNICDIYRNDSGTFVNINASLDLVHNSEVAWGDYDNDGDLDLVLAGYTGTVKLSKIYRNDAGVFTDIAPPLVGLMWASVAWGDYDNDGDLDLLISGTTGEQSPGITKIYRNDSLSFVDIDAGLTGLMLGSTSWGDYDNDGDLDLLITGTSVYPQAQPQSKLYRNDGNGVFTYINASLTGVYISSAAWGDVDNDGDLDILLSGSLDPNGNITTKIYRNNDNGVFTDINAPLTGTTWSSVSWGDYDNDGDLDILHTGSLGGSYISNIYRNEGVSDSFSSTMFKWFAGSDSQTPKKGLTYNLRVGTTPGGNEIMSAMARNSDGHRKISAIGNTNHDTSWTINNLPEGTYYWSVQYVNHAFEGSAFEAEQNVIVAYIGVPNLSNSNPAPGTSITVTAQVTTTNPTVVLLYGKPGQTTADSILMTPVSENFSGIIPGSAVTQEGLWFRIRAQNNAGVVYYPASGNQPIDVQITNLGVITTESAYPNGIGRGSYFTIGMSFNGTIDLTDYFGSQKFVDSEPSNWRALMFDPVTQSFSDVTSLSGGHAYGIYQRLGNDKDLFSSVNSPSAIASDVFNNWTLKPGWNLVPWPYTFKANVVSTDSSKIGTIWWRNGKGGWEAVTQLKPYGGYMIRNKTVGDITVKSTLTWTRSVSKMASQPPGAIRFIAESGEYRDAFNFLGTSESAMNEFDNWDELEPFTLDAGINAYFVTSSSETNKKLSYDIRSSSESGHVWDLVVENTTGNKMTTLSWESTNLNGAQEMVFFDITHNEKVDASALNSYAFDNSGKTKFKVIVGEKSWVEVQTNKIEASLPSEFALSQNYPNPFNPTTTIRFDVANAGKMKITVYNILGQEVATLVDAYYETGRNYQAIWNGKDLHGRKVASGVYIYRLETGKTSKTKKMLFIK